MTNLDNKIDKQIFETKLKDLELMSVPNWEQYAEALNYVIKTNCDDSMFHTYMQRLHSVKIKWRNSYGKENEM